MQWHGSGILIDFLNEKCFELSHTTEQNMPQTGITHTTHTQTHTRLVLPPENLPLQCLMQNGKSTKSTGGSQGKNGFQRKNSAFLLV